MDKADQKFELLAEELAKEFCKVNGTRYSYYVYNEAYNYLTGGEKYSDQWEEDWVKNWLKSKIVDML